MPHQLQPATEADAERAAQIEKDAYAGDPFSQILFPGPFPEPPAGQKKPRAEELRNILRDDPSGRWLKVVDTDIEPSEDNRQMIGFAQWNISDGLQVPAKTRTFGPGVNVEACEELCRLSQEIRDKRVGIKHLHLRLLHVEPKHQRRGASKTLVTWGVLRSPGDSVCLSSWNLHRNGASQRIMSLI
ncbi:hypothetical protein GGS21DRAFT_68915 [Xylaria nigripes]|nr:hypothetical protein GGS21DRAFT_68915 [Xylaria nigripes]